MSTTRLLAAWNTASRLPGLPTLSYVLHTPVEQPLLHSQVHREPYR
ncbi:hypothetical protein [Streptomyces sp. NPDC097640]